MKKVFTIIFLCLFIFIGYYVYDEYSLKKILNNVEDTFVIEDYRIFGTHFNISGCIDKIIDSKFSLVLKNNNKEINIDSIFYNKENKTCFYLSDKNNEGVNLDELSRGKYLLLIKDENENYYTLKNSTEYENIEYYTITRNNTNNKINILFDNISNKDYVEFRIRKSKLPSNVYDITIDPGHGGDDVGAIATLNNKEYYEVNLTLEISLLLKQELENIGLKVKLTRNDDISMDEYGDNGRVVIANDVKSKYSLSLHLNSTEGSMNYGGVEVYVPNDINYEFSKLLADNLSNIVGYSKKKSYKVLDGVYYKYFSESDIEESKNDMLKNNMEPYNIKVGAPYMYMIRELGGINTYAYVDGRNDYHGLNKYYNSNVTVEPYLIELGYMNYSYDLEKLVNEKETFSKEITKTIKKWLNL